MQALLRKPIRTPTHDGVWAKTRRERSSKGDGARQTRFRRPPPKRTMRHAACRAWAITGSTSDELRIRIGWAATKKHPGRARVLGRRSVPSRAFSQLSLLSLTNLVRIQRMHFVSQHSSYRTLIIFCIISHDVLLACRKARDWIN